MSGGVDKLINIWDYQEGKLSGTLIAHEQNVCKLTVFRGKKTEPFIFGSSSWDGSARCWTEEFSPSSCLILRAEGGGSCWSVAALGRDVFVTGHADRSLRIWRGDKQVQAVHDAHRDVVRDLLPAGPNHFLSVGNDGMIKVWNSNNLIVLQSIEGHPSFIYGMAWNGKDRVATFGEEGMVKLWKWLDGKLEFEDQLRVPMMSAWSAAFLNESVLIIGGSSGSFYIFSCESTATSDFNEMFEAEMRAFDAAASANKTAEIEKNAQDASVLKYPGEIEGKTVLVRRENSSVIEAHQWTGNQWQNLGQVIDPATVPAPDFSFKVELDDTGRSYDLPYTRGENPYTVAKNFLERNDLPLSHLDEVANFIVKNAGVEIKNEEEYSEDEDEDFEAVIVNDFIT